MPWETIDSVESFELDNPVETPAVTPQQEVPPQESPENQNWVPVDKQENFEPLIPNERRELETIKASLDKPEKELGRAPASLNAYEGMPLNEAATLSRIAEENKIPFDEVYRNKNAWTKWDEQKKNINHFVDATTKESKNPKTSEWAKNPSNMALIRNDIENVAALEKNAGLLSVKKSFTSTLKDATEYSLRRTYAATARIPAVIASASLYPQNLLGDIFDRPDWKRRVPDELIDNPVALYFDKTAEAIAPKELNEQILTLVKEGKYSEAAKNGIIFTAANSSSFLAMSAAFLLGQPNIGLAYIGATSAGDAIKQGKEKDPTQQFNYMMMYAGSELLWERLGTFNILKGIEKSIAQNVGKSASKEFAKAVGFEIAKSAPVEGLTEGATEFSQDFSDWLTGNPEAFEGTMDRVINAVMYGAIAGSIMSSGHATASGISQAKTARKNAKVFEEALKLAEESKLRQAAPKKFEELIDKQNEDEPDVYIPVEVVETYFQDDQESKKKFLDDLGLTKEDIEYLKDNTGEMPIPKSYIMTNDVARKMAQEKIEDIKTTPEVESVNVSKEQVEAIKEEIASYEKEIEEYKKQAEIPDNILAMREVLMAPKKDGGFNMKAEDADANIALVMSGAEALTRQTGETIKEWDARVKPILVVGGQYVTRKPGALLKEGDTTTKGLVEFTDGQTIIRLFDSANYSTFAHEMSHVFFKDMESIVKAGKGDQQFIKDYEALLKFSESQTFDTKAQEKMAKAFEVYLQEGKAPSVELTSVFERFRNWLTTIYGAIKNRDIKINNDVREVFNRLLASQRDIDSAMAFYSAKKSISDVVELEEKVKNEIKYKKKKALQSAQEKQIAKYIKAFKKSKEGRAKLLEQAKTKVNSKTVYAAIEAIKAFGGLGPKDLDILTKEEIETIRKAHPGVISKGKETAGNVIDVMVKNNFASKEELLATILQTQNKEAEIKLELSKQEVMAEQEIRAEVNNDQTVRGEEAYHNEAQLAILLTELDILKNKVQAEERKRLKKIEKEAYKAAAKETLEAMPYKKVIQYSYYSRLEAKYAKLALKYTLQAEKVKNEEKKSELYIKAHDATRLQIVNHIRVVEAIRIKEELNKLEKQYSITNTKKFVKNVDSRFANAILSIINTYQFNEQQIALPGEEAVSDITKLGLDEYALEQIPTWIIKGQIPVDNFKNWRDLKTSDLRDIDAVLKTLQEEGKGVLKSALADEFSSVEALVEESKGNIEQLADAPIFEEGSLTGRAYGLMTEAVNKYKIVEFIFDHLDNFSLQRNKGFGPLMKMFNLVQDAETKYSDIVNNTQAMAAESWKTLGKAIERMGKKVVVPGLNQTKEMKLIGRSFYTPQNLIAILLNTGTENNLNAIKKGYQYTEEQIQAVAAMFTKEELLAIQNIWDVTNTFFSQIDSVNFKLNNRHINAENAQNISFRSKEGELVDLKGGYYPLIFDELLSDVVADRNATAEETEKAIVEGRRNAVIRIAAQKSGFTKSRVKGHGLPPKLSLGIWFSHVQDAARYISHAEILRDVNRVVTNKTWKDAVREKTGRRGKDAGYRIYDAVKDWTEYQILPGRKTSSSGLVKFFDKQRRLATTVILGANVSVSIKQRLSLFSAIKDLGLMRILGAFKDTSLKTSVLGLQSSKDWQDITTASEYMRIRENSLDREIRDTITALKENPKASFKILGRDFSWSDMVDTVMVLIKMNDRATVSIVWKAAFNKYVEEHKIDTKNSEKALYDAVRFADRSVSRSQPSSLNPDLNAFQRNEGIFRAAIAFMTWQFKAGNRAINLTEAYRNKAATKKDIAEFFAYEILLNAWANAIITTFFLTFDLPEEWDWLYEAPIETVLAWIPLVRDIPASLKYRKPVGDVPALEGINRAVQAYKSTTAALDNDKEWSEAFYDIAKAVEFQTGVPAIRTYENMVRSYENLKE